MVGGRTLKVVHRLRESCFSYMCTSASSNDKFSSYSFASITRTCKVPTGHVRKRSIRGCTNKFLRRGKPRLLRVVLRRKACTCPGAYLNRPVRGRRPCVPGPVFSRLVRLWGKGGGYSREQCLQGQGESHQGSPNEIDGD